MNWLATLGNISVWTQNSLGNYSSFVVLRHSMHSQIFPTFFSRKCKPNVPFTFPSHSFFCLATILHTMAWSPSCHIYLLEAAWKHSQLAIRICDEMLFHFENGASSEHARHSLPPIITPPKINMSTENQWLEDVFSIEIVPFLVIC